MQRNQTLAQMVIYGVIGLAAVGGAILLGFTGDLPGETVGVILIGALALAGGAATSTGAVYAVVNGKSVVTPQLVAEQGASNRTAIVAAAAAPATTVAPVTPIHSEPTE